MSFETKKNESLSPFQIEGLDYLRKKVPDALGNYTKIHKLHNEMSDYLDSLNDKLKERIIKNECAIITNYDGKMTIIKDELSDMKNAYNELERDILGTGENTEISRLQKMIRKQWNDIQNLLEFCRKFQSPN